MSWDGEGRRPYKDKKKEKHRFRRLTLSLLQLNSLAFMDNKVSDELYLKCVEAQKIEQHFVARRRAERRILELLRHCTEEEILFLEASLQGADTLAAEREERVLRQRDLLLEGGNAALTQFVTRFPEVNIQRLRQLIRNRHQELSREEVGERAGRELDALIRELFISDEAQ
jgi:ribosome-associated protein